MQGGVFSDDGAFLFTSNGYYDGTCGADGCGIWVHNPATGAYEGESGSGYGPFNYEIAGSSSGQEPEGLDYFPTTAARTPGISGQLHAILLNNDWIGSDSFWLKHYKIWP
jgi:hypothetical protein